MERYRPTGEKGKEENKVKVFLGSIVNFIVELTSQAIKQLAGNKEQVPQT